MKIGGREKPKDDQLIEGEIVIVPYLDRILIGRE